MPEDGDQERAPPHHPKLRDTLVVLLTLTTGAVDATSFLALGKVFSSVVTGDLALLGIAVGVGGSALAARAGVALIGYSAGVMAGAPITARSSRGPGAWPVAVTHTLMAETAVLVVFTVVWETVGGHPTGGLQVVLVLMLAGAMGMQSVAVRKLGQMSSTYLTSTLTGVLAGLATGGRPEGFSRSLGALVAIIAGAAIGAALVENTPVLVPIAVLVPITAVTIVSATGFGGGLSALSRRR